MNLLNASQANECADASRPSTFTFLDADGWEIFVRRWEPVGRAPKAAVQIVHGVADHSGRYDRFARFLNRAGYVVYANDHRGHGNTAKERRKFGIAGDDGWNAIVRDLKQLSDLVSAEHPQLPLYLFAHSLGSLMAQQYLERWGGELRGAILSGTLGSLANLDERLAMIESQATGDTAERPSPVFTALLASFNKPFELGETWLDWLSRDVDEVHKYIADPFCRVAICNRLAADIFREAKQIWSDEREVQVPRELPLLVIAGEADPVGENNRTIRALIDRYQRHGMTQIESKFYPAARHELLNELNRDEVQHDILAWLESKLPS
jgi:alpha-beta hydrolase superfamily lysophospholipase